MSWQPDNDPEPGNPRSCDAIEQVIVPRARDLGGFSVRRALPAAGKQMVGPFIFFDQMGPAEFLIGTGIDVRPHPHIGLATVTYLFDGEIVHRDSLGTALSIRPGELNLMSAGRGIVHSERTGPEQRAKGPRLFGIQAWAALPKSHEEGAPAFAHHDAGELPRIAGDGKTVRVIMGMLYGETSPAAFPHPRVLCRGRAGAGRRAAARPRLRRARGFVASGEIDIAGETFTAGRLLVFRPGDRISILALSQARLMLLGGEPMDGPRHIWWNFVSSSKDRIDAAKADWKAKRFAPVPGDAEEFIPLPE